MYKKVRIETPHVSFGATLVGPQCFHGCSPSRCCHLRFVHLQLALEEV